MLINILNYLVAIATIILSYRIWIERTMKEKKISELKGLLYSLAICFILLWVINIFIGFVK